ncbi:MAG: transporter [Hydrocarboniphaga sp.]|uniref:efflux RND transporter permease subunit n=1 Tax=Hydrocarboniphaga sp. TaxID=2033016 RepID=UPI002625C5A1|nr:MMPL family transporter [Hydrocarboniphaga sp.]MDB5969988.1 transporter [Hydrocarboniphaga sp.]
MASMDSTKMPVVENPADFDRRSGNTLERLIFNYRLWVVAICLALTALLGWQTTRLQINASFERMIPLSHPFIKNYLANKSELKGLGNTLRIVVENPRGDVFDAKYLQRLSEINDALFLTRGVDRAWMKSLWTPLVQWTEVTEDGFSGGPVMPPDYDGSDDSVQKLRINVGRSGIIGALVASDLKSSMIVLPLLDVDPETGRPLSYGDFSARVERDIRGKFEADGTVKIHIVGFAKLVGDLIAGLRKVMAFFAIAALIAAGIIYCYTRCPRSTALVMLCSLVAVVWQLGSLNLLGLELDPYSILVPFLVFAIGVSHGAQKMNGIMQDIGRGTHRYVAARYTFRRLFLAGLTALAADAVGFGVLAVIDIPVIRNLAIAASIGVAGLVVTNLLLLPVLLSFVGVAPKAAHRALRADSGKTVGDFSGRLLAFLGRFTERRWATAALVITAVITVLGFVVSQKLKIGDLDSGAPELRQDSRYNRDNRYINEHYGLSSDVLAVIVKTDADGCTQYPTMVETDRLGWLLRQTPGVQAVASLADRVRLYTSGGFEGSPKWFTISNDPNLINPAIAAEAALTTDLMNADCSVFPVVAYLQDHKAETLKGVVETVRAFAKAHDTANLKFMLAAGSAGIEAATNIVVERANRQMLVYVYGAIVLLCFITFRSWRAVVVAIVPLLVTTVLCEALMVALGIGVKVATLPVIALGVGIGVDYALYLLSVQLAIQRQGVALAPAYQHALRFTGKVVALVGITLASGVATWAWSPIKFQADTGLLLAFMFLWNMLGALILIPALSHFLLPTRSTAAVGAVS